MEIKNQTKYQKMHTVTMKQAPSKPSWLISISTKKNYNENGKAN